MADNNFYPVEIPAEDAKQGISTGYEASRTAGILYGDGQGGIRTARPGEDYGYPLLQGNGPPGGSTVANLGQHYFDMTAAKPPYEYICVGYTAFGFVWTVYGDTGAGFQVLGRFSSLEALEAAVSEGLVPKPSPGDAYFIGDEAPYDMYFWDIMTQTWAYYGPLGGAGGSTDVTGIPPHGDAGQVLKKLSDADYDVGWGEAVPDGSVTNARLADSSVTAGKIANGAVTNTKIADSSVTRAKLAQDALYSPLTATGTVAAYSFSVGDLGKTVAPSSGASSVDVVFTMSADVSAAMPYGAEIAVLYRYGKSLKIVFETGASSAIVGDAVFVANRTYSIPERFGMVALKKVDYSSSSNVQYWLVTGNVEVVE